MPMFCRDRQGYILKEMECSGQRKVDLVYLEELTTCNDTYIMYNVHDNRIDAVPKYACLWDTN